MSSKRGYFLNLEESVEDATTVSAGFRWNGADYIVTIAGPHLANEAETRSGNEACGRDLPCARRRLTKAGAAVVITR